MSKGIRFGILLLVVLSSTLLAMPVAAAPAITQVQSQVTVLQDGRLQVKYHLTFVDDDSRTQITTIGPFDLGHAPI
jgi:hypothetical protein